MNAKHLHRLTLILSLNELRVFLYIWKWTGAIGRGDVILTYDEFANGRKKKKKIQGERLDSGCGIHHKKEIISESPPRYTLSSSCVWNSPLWCSMKPR